jgi:hypothetical protein
MESLVRSRAERGHCLGKKFVVYCCPAHLRTENGISTLLINRCQGPKLVSMRSFNKTKILALDQKGQISWMLPKISNALKL